MYVQVLVHVLQLDITCFLFGTNKFHKLVVGAAVNH